MVCRPEVLPPKAEVLPPKAEVAVIGGCLAVNVPVIGGCLRLVGGSGCPPTLASVFRLSSQWRSLRHRVGGCSA
jgi:hypothetical protein